MTDLLRALLDIRDAIAKARKLADAYGYTEALEHEFKLIDSTERKITASVNQWDGPE